MEAVVKTIRDWSETWGLLIPLLVMLIYQPRAREMRSIRIYVWIGFLVSLAATVMYVYYKQLPASLKNNNVLYNLHSFVRVVFFSWFIMQYRFGKSNRVGRSLVASYLIFTSVNFIFWTTPLYFSQLHFVAESIVLLLLCIIFFFRAIRDESETDWIKHPAFLVCAGISLYEAVNFFTFLFYNLLIEYKSFLKVAWTIHNLTLVVLGIMLALGLYKSKKQQIMTAT